MKRIVLTYIDEDFYSWLQGASEGIGRSVPEITSMLCVLGMSVLIEDIVLVDAKEKGAD